MEEIKKAAMELLKTDKSKLNKSQSRIQPPTIFEKQTHKINPIETPNDSERKTFQSQEFEPKKLCKCLGKKSTASSIGRECQTK